jgi:hypothetical protein
MANVQGWVAGYFLQFYCIEDMNEETMKEGMRGMPKTARLLRTGAGLAPGSREAGGAMLRAPAKDWGFALTGCFSAP